MTGTGPCRQAMGLGGGVDCGGWGAPQTHQPVVFQGIVQDSETVCSLHDKCVSMRGDEAGPVPHGCSYRALLFVWLCCQPAHFLAEEGKWCFLGWDRNSQGLWVLSSTGLWWTSHVWF